MAIEREHDKRQTNSKIPTNIPRWWKCVILWWTSGSEVRNEKVVEQVDVVGRRFGLGC